MWISSSAGQVHSGHTYRTAWFARDRLGRSMDCKTPFDALAVKSSVAQKGAGAKSSLLLFSRIEVSFNFNQISLLSQEDTRAVPPLLTRVAACGSFHRCHDRHGHRHPRLQ